MPNKRSDKKRGAKGRKMTDLPLAPKHTYDTMSCRLPNISQSCSVRVMQSSILTANGSSAVSNGYNFTLTQAGTGSAFFDLYKIEAIRFSIMPQNTGINLASPSVVALTDVYCVIDYDDSTALSSVAAAQTFATCVKLSPGQSCSRLFAPHIAVAAYNGAFSGFLNEGPRWIDSASPSVQHYGVKVFIPATGVVGQSGLQTWTVTIEYYLAFKNTF
jgi:hypothetical protein